MDQELDRIADVVAARIRAQLGSTLPSTANSCGDECNGDDCGACGHCAEIRPEEVKAVVNNGASRISASPGTQNVDTQLAGLIDHTLLKPGATPDDIKTLCDEARRYEFATVCVNSVPRRALQGAAGQQPGEGLRRGRLSAGGDGAREPRPSRRGRPCATAPARSTW